jgi:hypothetical protein
MRWKRPPNNPEQKKENMKSLLEAISPTARALLSSPDDSNIQQLRKLQLFSRVVNLIALERQRQENLFHGGAHHFSVASASVNHDRKLRVITEEIGEVAKEIDLLEAITKGQRESADSFSNRLKARREKLRKELVQVAAVAVAWLESLEEPQP